MDHGFLWLKYDKMRNSPSNFLRKVAQESIPKVRFEIRSCDTDQFVHGYYEGPHIQSIYICIQCICIKYYYILLSYFASTREQFEARAFWNQGQYLL